MAKQHDNLEGRFTHNADYSSSDRELSGFSTVPASKRNHAFNLVTNKERVPSSNRYALFEDNMTNDDMKRLFPQDSEVQIQLQIKADQARKETEWEQTKKYWRKK